MIALAAFGGIALIFLAASVMLWRYGYVAATIVTSGAAVVFGTLFFIVLGVAIASNGEIFRA